jgi:hypothetical protein
VHIKKGNPSSQLANCSIAKYGQLDICTDGQISDAKVGKAFSPRLLTVLCIPALAVAIASGGTVHAQQTVFNVPTTDVLESGKVYVELDISAKPNEPRFSTFVPRVVVGVGGDVEVGLNVLGNIQPGSDSTTLAPAVKWRVYRNEDNGWAIVVGSNLFIPVRNKSYTFGTYTYLMSQKSFKTGTRLGFGGSFFSENVAAPNAIRGGGQFTIEHAINRRIGVQADWFTGKHSFGYFTTGGYFRFTPRFTGFASYSMGNANITNGNHFLYFELGYNVN